MEIKEEFGAEIKPIYILIEKITFIYHIFFSLWSFIEILMRLNKIRTLCIVGYDENLIFMKNKKFTPESDPLFSFFKKTMLLSPKLFSNIEEASTKYERHKNSLTDLLQNKVLTEKLKPYFLHNMSHLRIWRPWDLRAMGSILRWRKTRSILEKSDEKDINLILSAGLKNWKCDELKEIKEIQNGIINDYKSFYGTLLACMLSISTGFFILYVTEKGTRGLGIPWYSRYIIENILPPLGHVVLLVIFGLSIFIPVWVWFKTQKRLGNGSIDTLFVIHLGAFPFFMQNVVAIFVQFHYRVSEGGFCSQKFFVELGQIFRREVGYIDNIKYFSLYILFFVIYFVIIYKKKIYHRFRK